MTKSLLGLFVVSSLCMVSASAFADDTPAAEMPVQTAPIVTTLKPVTVYGRSQLPIVIELRRLSAAHEASVAHETLHNALVAQATPAGLRPQAK
jgi:hypothetical protein